MSAIRVSSLGTPLRSLAAVGSSRRNSDRPALCRWTCCRIGIGPPCWLVAGRFDSRLYNRALAWHG